MSGSPSGSVAFHWSVRNPLRKSRRGDPSDLESSSPVKMPRSSGAEVSRTLLPPEPERSRTSAGSSAARLSIAGAPLWFRYAASVRRMMGACEPSPDMRTRHCRKRPSGAGIAIVFSLPVHALHGLHVVSGAADSPERNANSTLLPDGASPSQRNVPKRLVRPVSLTAET